MRVYKDVDMRNNRILNCPDLFHCVDLTRAEYEALRDAGLLDENVYYNVIDDAGESLIHDDDPDEHKTWSSSKIAAELEKIKRDRDYISEVDNSSGGRTVFIGRLSDVDNASGGRTMAFAGGATA